MLSKDYGITVESILQFPWLMLLSGGQVYSLYFWVGRCNAINIQVTRVIRGSVSASSTTRRSFFRVTMGVLLVFLNQGMGDILEAKQIDCKMDRL